MIVNPLNSSVKYPNLVSARDSSSRHVLNEEKLEDDLQWKVLEDNTTRM